MSGLEVAMRRLEMALETRCVCCGAQVPEADGECPTCRAGDARFRERLLPLRKEPPRRRLEVR